MPKVGLLILQGTPFCNFDCKYCYLPNRDDRSFAPKRLFDTVAHRLQAEGLTGKKLKVLWHAGEPLVYPQERYEYCVDVFRRSLPNSDVEFSIQTNGSLITPDWCEFFVKNSINVGVSLDGPAAVHDWMRLSRNGKGTHSKTMQGLDLLREHGIPIHVLAVVTRRSLTMPNEIYDYFASLGVSSVSFNLEEVEGINQTSSLDFEGAEAEIKEFFLVLFRRISENPGGLWVREYEDLLRRIFSSGSTEAAEAIPFGILSVDHAGRYYTFSPELIGMSSSKYPAGFSLGNMYDFGTLITDPNDVGQQIIASVAQGVERCRRDCDFFSVCGSGFVSNKLNETGSFDAGETRQCILSIQTQVHAMLEVVSMSAKGLESR